MPRWPWVWSAYAVLGWCVVGCTTVGNGGTGGGGFRGIDIQLGGGDVADGTGDGATVEDPTQDAAADTAPDSAEDTAEDSAEETVDDAVGVDGDDDATSVHDGAADAIADATDGTDGADDVTDAQSDDADATAATDADDAASIGDGDDGDDTSEVTGLEDAIVGADLDGGGLGIADGNADGDAVGDAAAQDAAQDADADDADAAASDAGPAGPAPAVPLSSCKGANGSKTCSVDGKLRLECILGAWTPLAHCGFGVCAAKAQPSGPAQLSCSVPASSHAELAAACARTISCFAPSQSLERCMRAALAPSLEAADAGGGALIDPMIATFASLAPALACISTSNSCATLAQCIHLFPQPKCTSGASSGCDGNLAWQCTGGAAVVGDCAKIGVNCAVVAGQPRCLADAPCPIGDVSSCAGRVNTVCLQTSAGNRAAKIDCGALGLQCVANLNPTSNIAAGCGAASACPAAGSGIPACEGAKLATCSANKLVETTCPAQSVCLLQDDFGVLAPACPDNATCESALCGQGGSCSHVSRCQGSEVWYCEQGQPRSFDCASIGKSCVSGAAPRCN